MAERSADDVGKIDDEPNKGDVGGGSESTEKTLARHEELHHEHRDRIDEHDGHIDEHHDRLSALEKHCGLRGEERSREERGEARDRRRGEMSQRRRHD